MSLHVFAGVCCLRDEGRSRVFPFTVSLLSTRELRIDAGQHRCYTGGRRCEASILIPCNCQSSIAPMHRPKQSSISEHSSELESCRYLASAREFALSSGDAISLRSVSLPSQWEISRNCQ